MTNSKRTDYILDDLFLDYSLPSDGRSFFESKDTIGEKLATAVKSLWTGASDMVGSAADALSLSKNRNATPTESPDEGSPKTAEPEAAIVNKDGVRRYKPQAFVRNMQHTIEIFSSVIPDLGVHDPQIQTAAHVFRECMSVCKSVPQIVINPLDDMAKQARHASFHSFIEKLLPRVRQLSPGTTMMVPAGWMVSTGGRRNDESAVGKVILLVLHRRIEKPDEFTLCICNGSRDQGLSYHPVKADPAGELRLVPLVLKGVKRERAINGAFWVMIMKPLMYPHPNNGPKQLYASVLPSLSGIPIDAQLTVYPELAGQGLWLPPAEGGDKSGAISATYALFSILLLSGKSVFEAQWLSLVQLRRCMLDSVAEIGTVPVATRGLMLRSLAWHACRLKDANPDRVDTTPIEEYIDKAMGMPDPHKDTWMCPRLDRDLKFDPEDCHYWLFDRVALMEEVESQAGKPKPPKVLIPVPLTKVRDEVRTLADLRELWSDVVHCCALLQNQQSQIHHAQALVFGLVLQAITRVTPCITSPWWDNVAMTEDSRVFLLKQLHLIIGHFAASAFSLGGRAIDGGRIVTSSALMALCDKLCRTISTDSPSVFAQHYGGTAPGPVTAYGLGPGLLAEETACSLLLSPDLVTTRATILEYFISLNVAEDHQLFRFDERVDFTQAEYQLVEQLCLAMGMYNVIPESPYLITGEKKDLLTYFPELGWLRDIAFLSKILMNPDGEKLPQIKPGGYRMSDAEMIFKFDKKVFVKGFGLKQLDLCGGYKSAKSGVVDKLKGMFFWKRGTGRVYPSMADPSNLCNGDVIACEDDVLHCKNLPKFTSLGRASVERLVTLLTAPYLRIPLLVAFFRDREKVAALAEPRIQAVMDAALFEPGKWRSVTADLASGKQLNPSEIRIPGGEPTVLFSPWGLMYNELIYAPKNTIEGVIDLLDAAIERDSGRFGSPSSKVILYACRLTCRVARFIDHVLSQSERVTGLSTGLPLDVRFALENGLRILRDKLCGQSWSILNKWSDRALSENRIEDACSIQAHLALVAVCKSVTLDRETASTLLASQAYLAMNHRWSSINASKATKEEEQTGGADTALGGVYEFELLDVFAATRRKLFELVSDPMNPQHASETMDTVVKVLTQSARGAKGGLGDQFPKVTNRNWVHAKHLPGVFVPETEAPKDTFLIPQAKENYAAWLLRTTRPLALTVNLNLGQFSLTDQQLMLIPDWAFSYSHYVDLFGTSSVQVAEVKSTTNREWLRIVGHSHDVQRWSAKCERPPKSIASRSLPAGHWASEILFATVQGLTDRHVLPPNLKLAEEYGDKFCLLAGEIRGSEGTTFRDVLVRRDIPTVFVFDVIEYGRRWYRRLVWGSDESLALSDCIPIAGIGTTVVEKVPVPGMACGRVALQTSDVDLLAEPSGLEETLVITRNIKKDVGEQQLIPSVFLRGILPDIVLSRYRFWQSQDGSLEGEWIPIGAEKTGLSIRVSFVEKENSSTVKITRERTDRFIGNQVLLNLSFSSEGSKISALAAMCRRLDNFSNVIAWGNEDSGDVEEVEFPRLRLVFKRKGEKLFCEQHEGYWLLNEGQKDFSQGFEKILRALIGGTVVLCSANGSRAIVVGAHVKPMRYGPGGHSVFARDGTVFGHYFYPAHLSEQFVTTQSLMSAVHLLRTRWMSRHYTDAVDMIPCVFADSVDQNALAVLKNQPELVSDIHPDSHGLRLRLALAILPFTTGLEQIPWDLSETMQQYLLRVRYCSAGVRLSLQDERYLLEDVIVETMKKPVLSNRLMLLRGIDNCVPSVPCTLALSPGDGWCSDGSVPSNDAALRLVWPKLGSYTRPLNDIVGVGAVEFIVENSYPNSSDRVNCMMLVEIACRWFNFRVDQEDDTVTTCYCLNRLSVPSTYDGLTHILASIFTSPALLTQVQPIPKKSALDILGNANYSWLKALAGIAKQAPEMVKPADSWVPEDSVVCPPSDWETAPFVNDCASGPRLFAGDSAFGNRPLEKLCEKFVSVTVGTKAEKPNVDQLQQLIEALGKHPNANTNLGQMWVKRVRGDVSTYLSLMDEEEQYKPKCPVSEFRSAVQAQLDQDWDELRKLMDRAVQQANSGGIRIAQQAGRDVELGFSTLIRMLMSENGDAVLSRLHTIRKEVHSKHSLSREQVDEIMNTVGHAMFRAVRVGQLLRTLGLLPPVGREQDISEAQLNKLLRELAARRHFCTGHSEKHFSYDPRLLGAEFLFGVMFRETQVTLLRTFMERAERNDPIVHQMIMGAGKTTVLAPLLGMILATPRRLVVSCVPTALLEFSREVMRERYSSPVLAIPVVTFVFNRQDKAEESVLRKLQTARTRRAVVVATPQTLKSVMLKLAELRYMLLADDGVKQSAVIAATRNNKFLRKLVGAGKKMGLVKRGPKKMKEWERDDIKKQIEVCIAVVQTFKTGLVIMDEVDMLLHPLRSELRWPLGNKAPLDLTEPFGNRQGDEESIGMRWRVTWHLIAAVMEDAAHLPFQEIQESRTCIENLKSAIRTGIDAHSFATTPHFVILSRSAYQQTLLPHLTKWAIVFIRSKSVALQIPDSSLISFLESHGSEEITRVLPDREVKVLVLFRQWLHVLLPFVFSRKHRVEYGLLPKEWIMPGTPKSRKMLAVPYVGKDRPSPTSEFSHPDVLIGLSLISYRLNGLRRDDLRELVLSLREDMEDESGKPYYNRKSCQRWVKWIGEMGGRVRGFSWAGMSLTDVKERDNTAWREFPNGPIDEVLMNSIWPLELVDVRDTEQMDKLYILLNRSMSATIYYLFHCAFPEALDHTPSVLVASGQELGGDGLFGCRMGFSGTPNDLLPKAMGTCVYDAGCDGRIAATLTSPNVVTGLEVLEPDWTPLSLVKRVVEAAGNGKAHALIDCGALVTNLTNVEVADILLELLPSSKFDAVVYVSDNEDERLVLDRQTRKVIPFAQSGLPRHRCFTFYDQIHTTGIDIEQPLGCTAILTLGKDSSFRDYAQAAYRMRGLGEVGQQKLSLLVSQQVNFMINKSAPDNVESMPCKVLGWTILNSLAGEVGQYMLLCQQNVENLWRSSAWERLSLGGSNNSEECLDVLKEPVDYVIETDLSNRDTRYAFMQKKLKNYAKWLDQSRMSMATNILLDLERVGRSSDAARDGAKAIGKIELDSEQINENEITVEEEQEVTVQTQLVEELTIIAESEENVQEKNFSREGESVSQWKLSTLLDPHIPTSGGESSVNPFYPLKTFSIYSGILQKQVDPLDFPSCMLVSSNYYRSQWRLSSVKRLKNVIVLLEYLPLDHHKEKKGLLSSMTSSTPPKKSSQPDWLADPLAMLDEALQVLDLDAAHSLTAEYIEDALDCLFLDRGPASALHPTRILKGENSIPVADFKATVTAWYLSKRMAEITAAEERQATAAAKSEDQQHTDLLGVDLANHHEEALAGIDSPSRSLVSEIEPNRFYAIVTLAEAEYLRSAIHRLNSSVDCPLFALRVPGLLNRPLDVSYPLAKARLVSNPILPLMADQVARFVDCDPSGFTSAQITLLMKTLAHVPYAERKEWYLRNMQCRVRPNKPWQHLSMARMFVSPQEQAEMQLESALDRLQVSLVTRAIDPKVLFASWDLGKKGRVSSTDVISGIQALQVGGLTQVDINRIVRKAEGPTQFEGSVTLDGWLKLFPETMISKDKVDVYDNGFTVLSADQGLLTEIGGITDSHRMLFQMLKETDLNARYKVKLMSHDSVRKLWSSQGLNCPPITVWEATQLATGGGILHARSHSVRERVCLGNLVTFNHDKQLTQCTVIEVRDMFAGYPKKQQGETLEDWIEKVLPRPTSYRLIWAEKSGSKPLYIWRPVPRSEVFQAVGVVCTLTPKEPALTEVRTIPRQWLAREIVDIKDRALQGLTWKDSGRRIWAQELLSVMDADKEGNSDVFTMWQILSERFFIASGVTVQQRVEKERAAAPPALSSNAATYYERSLLDSPVANHRGTGAKPGFEVSLLDQSPVKSANRSQQPPSNSPKSLI